MGIPMTRGAWIILALLVCFPFSAMAQVAATANEGQSIPETVPEQESEVPKAVDQIPDENAEAAEQDNKKKLVAIFHMHYSGVENKSKDGTIDMTIAKAVDKAGHRAVSPQESENFLKSDQGSKFANCFSVKCSADAGKTLGVDLVVSGQFFATKDMLKINMQLIDSGSSKIIVAEKREIPKSDPIETPVTEMIAALFDQADFDAGPKPIAVEDIPEEEEETPEQQLDKEQRFYKGNLTTIGPMAIIPRNDRAGVLLGYRRLGFTHYLHVSPQVDLRFFPDDLTKESKLKLGFGVPLNLELFAGEDRNNDDELDKFTNAGHPRSEDWDSWRDAAKIIRYIQYGRKEDNIYVNINRTSSATIGHGVVMKRYIPNLDYFTTRVSAEFDGYGRYGGAEVYTNDITKYNVIGVLGFIKPASFFSDNWMAESFSLGMTYATDWDAPQSVLVHRDNSYGSYIYDATDIHFVGVDAELKVVKWPLNQPKVDIKVYTDYTQWIDNGGGYTLGALGRFNLYTKIRQAFRVRTEFRAFQDNYTPSYFDPFYEVMKYKYFSENKPATNKQYTEYSIQTKYLEFSNRSSDWNHVGGYFEFSYALLDYVGVTFAFDGASGNDNGNFLFHVEVPATKYFQIAATYYKANVDSVKNVFDPGASNTMLVALARLRPLQLLAFQFGIRKTVQPSARYYPNLESVWDLKADLDLSWEF